MIIYIVLLTLIILNIVYTKPIILSKILKGKGSELDFSEYVVVNILLLKDNPILQVLLKIDRIKIFLPKPNEILKS